MSAGTISIEYHTFKHLKGNTQQEGRPNEQHTPNRIKVNNVTDFLKLNMQYTVCLVAKVIVCFIIRFQFHQQYITSIITYPELGLMNPK